MYGSDGRVAVAVNISGVSDMALFAEQTQDFLVAFFGHAKPFSHEELDDASPVFFARKDASVLIIHGEFDNIAYVQQADRGYESLKAAGADVEYIRVSGADGIMHGVPILKNPVAKNGLRNFLLTRLNK